MKQNWIKFGTQVVKIGNSFSIRIPMTIIKELDVKEGDTIVTKVKRLDLKWTDEILNYWYKQARSIKKLNTFSDDKIILLSRLAHNEGKIIIEINQNIQRKNKDKKIISINADANTLNNTLKTYRKTIKKDFGVKLYKEYLTFRKLIDKKMNKNNKK